MLKGECNCQAVAYEIRAKVSDVYVCHCSICRKATGNTGMAVLVIPNDVFHWVRGEDLVKTWKKPGHDWQTWFCPTCGSTLPGTNDSERMFIPAGAITEGGEDLKVAAHIWVNSKAVWDTIGDAAVQYEENFEG